MAVEIAAMCCLFMMASTIQIATRSTIAIWLAGQCSPTPQYRAPKSTSKSGPALCRLYYEVKSNKTRLPIACITVADKFISF